MNNNLPKPLRGKHLQEEAAQLTPVPSGSGERVQKKRSKNTFSGRLFALVLASSAAFVSFLLSRPPAAASTWQEAEEEGKTACSDATL